MFAIFRVLLMFGIVSTVTGVVLALGFAHPFSASVKNSDLQEAEKLGIVKHLDLPPLSGWLIVHPDEVRPVIVFVHGRSGNRMQMFPLARDLFQRGYNVGLWDLRHHGNSTGAETYGKHEVGDVLKVVDTIRMDPAVDPERLALLGFSLGAAMSIGAAAADSECRIGAVVADSAYANLRETGFWYVRVFGYIPAFIAWPTGFITMTFGAWLSDLDMRRLNPRDWAASVRAPVLVIQGRKDRQVKPDSGREIYERLPGPKEFWLVPNAGHTDAFSRNRVAYVDRVSNFLSNATGPTCLATTTD